MTIKQAGSKYFEDKYTNLTKKKTVRKKFDQAFDKSAQQFNLQVKTSQNTTDGTESRSDFDKIISSNKLNQKQKRLIKKAIAAIDSSSNLSALNTKLEAVNRQAVNELETEEQLNPIFAFTGVAKASAEYWSENYEKWKAEESKTDSTALTSKGVSNVETHYGPGEKQGYTHPTSKVVDRD